MPKKQLSAQRGIEAACILFEINTRTDDILRMAAGAAMPDVYTHGPGALLFCAEWRAFAHAVVTAALMQAAPNAVLLGYLRQTGALLAAAEAPTRYADVQAAQASLTAFVDGPFAQYMPLLAHGQQAACPDVFCRRLTEQAAPFGGTEPDDRAKARLAAIMAMLMAAVRDKLDDYDILAD